MNTFASRQRLLTSAMLAACSILAVACGNASGSSSTGGNTSSTAGCTPGNVTINSISTEVFCGPAKAQGTFGGQTFTWSNGMCFNQMGMIGVNIGHEILDPTQSQAGKDLEKQYDYFGAEAQATKDGTYQGTAGGFYHGQDVVSSGTVTFSNNLQAGSFTGKTILTQQTFTASWTC